MTLKRHLTHLLPTTLIYKLLALGCAYGLWLNIAKQQIATLPITLPVTYTQVPAHYTIRGPTTVQLQLSGPRVALQQLLQQPLRLPIDLSHLPATSLPTSTQPTTTVAVELNQQTLPLPDNVRLLHYPPAIIKLQLQAQPHANAPEVPAP